MAHLFTIPACLVVFLVLCLLSSFPHLHELLRAVSVSTSTQLTEEDILDSFLDGDFTAEYFSMAEDPNNQQEAAGETANETFFEKAVRMSYATAIRAPQNPPPRKPFDINSWTKGEQGGLQDSDRTLLGQIYYQAESVFEFGMGESTLIASAVGVPRYSGVDSDPIWINMAREKSGMDHFRFYLADIGPTRLWGYPTKSLPKSPFDYQLTALSSEQKAFDVYLIDGRFRVACAAASFLHAAHHGADMSRVKVAVHDHHQPRRGYYDALSPIADPVHKAARLYVYQLKSTTTLEDIFRVWQANAGNPKR